MSTAALVPPLDRASTWVYAAHVDRLFDDVSVVISQQLFGHFASNLDSKKVSICTCVEGLQMLRVEASQTR